ncbi:MAG: NAD(P)/FAD-dependent oxidoreductase [Actinomycetota bacterium]|nr:NAD(P)/FAD-dependent oxidoreductase [Actinomycetota bacterium]
MDEIADSYDVVVIGGGAAGLAGAVALLRSRRSVLLVDGGDPRNAAAGHVHNFLTQDGTAPEALYAAGRAELRAYGGQLLPGDVDTLEQAGDSFRLQVQGRTVTARRVLLASGARDELPDLPGLAERWGIDVLHCPYCHGWEVRDQRIGVLATGPMAIHQALMFGQLSAQVTLLAHTGPAPSAEQQEQLAALGIPVLAGAVTQVDSDADGLTGVQLADGGRVTLDALVVAPVCRARAELLAPFGVRPVEVRLDGHLLGTQVESDPTGASTVPGIWVAGNVTNIQAQVISSAAAGLAAAAAINNDLITADAERAVQTYRARRAIQDPWDERYASMAQVWSGQPNGQLVSETQGLPPGRALDVGCGEGADALWLAARGWDVTALDVSRVALDRATEQADRVGAKVRWLHAGLLDAALPPASFDLVSAQYPALLRTEDHQAERALLDAVAPGGVLLVVHHVVLHEHAHDHDFNPDDYVGPAQVAALLDDRWRIEVNETRARHLTTGAGAGHTQDIVLRARRLS